ncbi:MAG: type II toxin-antitoxin system mRNA interferase toxin, RelE/StbE family [Patescibacteria group bacterium]
MIIRISSKFRKSYKRLPKSVKEKAKEKEQIFRANPFDSRLDTHKLHGKYKDYWAFTVVNQYRTMFAFVDSDKADFINIGTHDIYK